MTGSDWKMKLGGNAEGDGPLELGTRNAEVGTGKDETAAGASPHRVLAFHPSGANYLPDLRCSPAMKDVKERPGGSDKSLLKLYYFFTGPGFF
jgi:hypothetical protein